ncbi:MAG: hypothetical protein KBT03_10415 [Bacteroidales bacterium]|nr:hypothetical protein [Candidatus Scybalousia scybalohippi]
MEIRRGTTATIEIIIPDDINVAEAETMYVTVGQSDIPVIERSIEQLMIEGQTVRANLTQEETLALNHKINASIQIRLKLANGGAFASQKKTVDVKDVIKEGVI